MLQRKGKSGFNPDRRGSSREKEKDRALFEPLPHPVAQLRKLQQSIGNRAIVQMMRPVIQRTTTFRRLQTSNDKAPMKAMSQTSGRPLPDSLRSRFEQLSGQDMSEVEVHYDSDKPQEVDALAFAQGDEIHLAPGQERHLAHEAWHVIQQKRGQVRPTMQLRGMQMNDDPALEHEADVMAQRALTMQQEGNQLERGDGAAVMDSAVETAQTVADAPLQRFAVASEYNAPKGGYLAQYVSVVGEFVQETVKLVDNARSLAINWYSLENETDNHVKKWYSSAEQYVENPERTPKIIHADFGYAVEALTCRYIPSDFKGLQVRFQVASGHTRPDIVLNLGKQEIAWIDITSKKSAGHILAKDGSGWRNRPFVYEILYDPLNLQDLIDSSHDEFYYEYGNYIAAEHQIEYEEKEEQITKFRNHFRSFAEDREWTTGTGDSGKKRNETRNELFKLANKNWGQNNKKLTKGALDYFGLNTGPFGFSKQCSKYQKQSNRLGVEMVESAAKQRINERKSHLLQSSFHSTLNFLNTYVQNLPVVGHFFALIKNHEVDREMLKSAMLLKATISDLIHLRKLCNDCPNELNHYDSLIDEQIKQYPQQFDHGTLWDWHQKSMKIIRKAQADIEKYKNTNDQMMIEEL